MNYYNDPSNKDKFYESDDSEDESDDEAVKYVMQLGKRKGKGKTAKPKKCQKKENIIPVKAKNKQEAAKKKCVVVKELVSYLNFVHMPFYFYFYYVVALILLFLSHQFFRF